MNEDMIMKKGMACLCENLGVLEVEIFISAIMKSAYDYTKWRQEYFENTYKSGDKSQLENFLSAAANHDPRGISVGLESLH